jgi:DNA-binding LytR/AlgR family response regulator
MEFIPVIKSKEIHRILTKELLYVEQYQRKIRLVTREITLETYGRIQEFVPYLGDNFMQCHQSLYVNMDQIRAMKDQSIQFFGGMEVPLSRDKFTSAKQRFSRYLTEGKKFAIGLIFSCNFTGFIV